MGKSDRVLNRHRGGKIRMQPALPITTTQILRDVYTPGVARVCLAIRDDPAKANLYTNLPNTVAVVTNGTAVLGLGDIGPLAGLPVMEGKAALFATLVGITAVPILVDTRDPARVVDTVTAIAPSFGAIQLEDIAAPECFEIEAELVRRLDRPVLHDDQHGTAVVALAALLTAMRRVGGRLQDRTVGQVGMGAAGLGIARLLKAYGVRRLLGADLREDSLRRLAAIGGERADLADGHARGGRRHRDDRRARAHPAGVGAQAASSSSRSRTRMRRSSRSRRSSAAPRSRPMARASTTCRDFPGLFKGALEARATRFTRRDADGRGDHAVSARRRRTRCCPIRSISRRTPQSPRRCALPRQRRPESPR